ncbi:hypothetical protein A3K64_02800 [Candidatus Micrarchaeota archaeon RBG_16_36_9]|nr:MAG: hypothetical protein A3K64_02800 [Candidatus Micrarchaeota archaeon RBG_16_36_9]
MPYKHVKLKSDKEIEKEETGIEIKVRRHNPLDLENEVVCYYCSNVIWPKCNLGVTDHPCALDCEIVVKEKKIDESCRYYERLDCKKGYYATGMPMHCPDYNGPKPHVINLGWAFLINYGGKEKFEKNIRASKK